MPRPSEAHPMLYRIVALLCLLLVVSPAGVFAQSQSEMNAQAQDAYKKSDAELNRVYKALTAKLEPSVKKQLVDAQLAWIKFRDADAKAKAAENEGGSIYPLVYFGRMDRLTRDRTAQLKSWLDEYNDR